MSVDDDGTLQPVLLTKRRGSWLVYTSKFQVLTGYRLICPMSPFPDQVPGEIISNIASYLGCASLCAIARTAVSLQPHAERLLYLEVDLTKHPVLGLYNWDLRDKLRATTLMFLRTISQNSRRLGRHPISFGAYYFDDHEAGEPLLPGLHDPETPRYSNLYAYAIMLMPNLTALKLLTMDTRLSNVLIPYDDPLRRKLGHLCLKFRGGTKEDLMKTSDDLVQYAKCQPQLRCLSLFFHDDTPSSDLPRIADPYCLEDHSGLDAADLFRFVDVLEGSNTAIRLLLPGRTVKSLLWCCHFSSDKDFNPPTELDPYPAFCKPYFTPAMCQAYGKLEHLAVIDQLPLFPFLTPFLTSLTTLFVHEYPERIGRDAIWEDSSFLGALKKLDKLEMLVLIPGTDVSEFWEWPDDQVPEEQPIFDACRSLKLLVILKFGHFEDWAGGVVYIPFVYERDCDVISASPAKKGLQNVLKLPYLLRGWSIFDVDSEVLKYIRTISE